MMMKLVKKEQSTFFSTLPEFDRSLSDKEPVWLQGMRTAARMRFGEVGFPTVRDEEWRFTSVAPIAEIAFRPAEYDPSGLDRETVGRLRFSDLHCPRLVFVNGCFCQELSSADGLGEGVKAASLAEVLRRDPEAAEPHLGRYASFQHHAFNALNTAYCRDGAFVYLPPGKVVKQPIHLLFLMTASGEAAACYPRNLIVAGGNSQASIVESYVGLGNGVRLTVPVTEIVAGDAAVIEHSRVQYENRRTFHIATLQYQQERASSITAHSIALGGALVRNNLTAVLDGEGAECTLNGLYLAAGQQHIDNHTRLEHAAPHCNSREFYKGILDGKSRGVFHGRIVVHRGAQKTDSKQTNNNLLLSDEALINTHPQLEIYADDVKCTHGATIGQLDRDALFYLRSRGIGEQAARSLLIYAFASDLLRRCKVGEVRRQLDEFLLGWLPAGESVREAIQV